MNKKEKKRLKVKIKKSRVQGLVLLLLFSAFIFLHLFFRRFRFVRRCRLRISEKVEDFVRFDSDAFRFDQIQKSVSIDAAFVDGVDGRIAG